MNVSAGAVFVHDTEREMAAVVSAVAYTLPSCRACVFSQLTVGVDKANLLLPDPYPCCLLYTSDAADE